MSSTRLWPYACKTQVVFVVFLIAFLVALPPARAYDDGSRVLYCVSWDADLLFTVAASGCTDSDMNRYSVVWTGVGLSVGLSANAYLIIYHPFGRSSIEGDYLGTRGSVALGLQGGNLGWFVRDRAAGEFWREDYLYVIGYSAGGAFDISALKLTITKH